MKHLASCMRGRLGVRSYHILPLRDQMFVNHMLMRLRMNRKKKERK